MKKLMTVSLVAILILVFGSLAFAAEKTFTYTSGYEPDSLDTNKCSIDVSSNVLYLLSAGLMRNIDGEIVPEIATHWDVSSDGLTYTFYLRQSVWSDGTALTAQDFAYSFQRYFEPDTGAVFVDNYYMIANAEAVATGEAAVDALGVKALDDYTLQIELTYPDMFFISRLAGTQYFYPLKQEVVEAFGPDYAADPSKLLTNGPFNLESWSNEAEIVLVRNENYWNRENIHLDKIVRLVVRDTNTVAAMYDAGEIDYMSVPATLVGQYPKFKTALTGGMQFLQFNVEGRTAESGKVIANSNFRKALSYAINREALSLAVAGPANQAAQRFGSPGSYAVADFFVNEYPYEGIPTTGDEQLAKEYLEKALVELNMTKESLPELRYLCMESNLHQLFAQALTATWESVLGLNNIDIHIVPIPQAIQGCMERKYDIYLQGLSGGLDPISVIESYVIGGGINWTGWEDEFYTERVVGRNYELDQRKFYNLTFEAEQYMLTQGPLEPLWYLGDSYVHKDYVTGLIRSSTGPSLQLAFVDIKK